MRRVQAGQLRTESGSPEGRSDYIDAPIPVDVQQRDAAVRTLDRLHTRGLLPDTGAARAETLARRDSWARRWITAAGDDDYAAAFVKRLLDPTHGHLRWTPQEAAAHQRVEQVRDQQRAMSLTSTEGGAMVPVGLDPSIIVTNAGATNPCPRRSPGL